MIIYSKNIVQFIHEIKQTIKRVLAHEIGLRVGRDRFYDPPGRSSYPIQVVVFNHKKMLGYFDPSFFELGFHECLMRVGCEQLHQVIRHELAHYMTFINEGAEVQPHGQEFKTFCQRMGWGDEVAKATACLEGGYDLPTVKENSILRKVEKLMALATSLNRHEAEAAMIKSQQLLLKHNIESTPLDEDRVVLKRLMKQKREDAKMRSIAKILETFFVSTVYHRAADGVCLEILGDSVNVEIAEYVATVLQTELETLWNQVKKEARLKGMVARNSFFLGIAKGYCNKLHALKREYENETTQALMVIEKKLIEAKSMAYPRLSSVRSSGSCCPHSSALGEKMGKHLNINPGVKGSQASQSLLGYER